VHLDFHKEDGEMTHGRLILLGGIQINMPPPMHDYFLPLTFEVRGLNRKTKNLREETFGEFLIFYY
jgi:hypothetical protein